MGLDLTMVDEQGNTKYTPGFDKFFFAATHLKSSKLRPQYMHYHSSGGYTGSPRFGRIIFLTFSSYNNFKDGSFVWEER